MGVHEIAEFLGVSRQRADELARIHPTFPKPAAVLRAGRIWLRRDIERWAKETGRRPKG
jgi:predicted DNA-binding transcriptional regulator AlpA